MFVKLVTFLFFNQSSVILVDEAQFFDDIKVVINIVETNKKTVCEGGITVLGLKNALLLC